MSGGVGWSGSSTERAIACAASVVLPEARHNGADAIRGTENHVEAEAGERSRYRVVRESHEGAERVRCEVSYALDLETRTARCIGVGLGRKYGDLKKSELALTLDFEGVRDGVWCAYDWKSRTRVAAADRNWQLRCAALAIMSVHRAPLVRVAIGYLDNDELDEAEVDAFDAPAYWDELETAWRRVRIARERHKAGETLSVTSGAHCRYCPGMAYCPAHTRMALAVLGEIQDVGAMVAELDPEKAGKAYEEATRWRDILERIRDSVGERARREPIPLSGGRRLALVECTRRSLDTKAAAEMLGDAAPYKTSAYTQLKAIKAKEGT